MTIRRIVPNLHVAEPTAAARFYVQTLGMQVVMDMGWIVTLADPDRADRELSLLAADANAEDFPEVSVEVSDVDEAYRSIRDAGAEIVYELSDEEWGVRRFFFRDTDGHVINVLSHRS